MKIADARFSAEEDGYDWASLPLVEKLNRIDSDEGHSIYERYFGEHYETKPAFHKPHWLVAVQRTWLCWGLGVEASREAWNPERLHIVASVGPFHLILMREWQR